MASETWVCVFLTVWYYLLLKGYGYLLAFLGAAKCWVWSCPKE